MTYISTGGVTLWLLPILLSVPRSAVLAQNSEPAPLFSQSPAMQGGLSDYVLFRFFFVNVLSVESFADGLKASGKDDTTVRAKFMREAGLTPTENALLTATAKRCTAELEAHERDVIVPSVQRLKAQHPGAVKASALPPGAAAQLAGLQQQHEQIVTGCIQTLRSAMGPERFQKLYEFVRGTEAPRIRQGPAPLPQKKQP